MRARVFSILPARNVVNNVQHRGRRIRRTESLAAGSRSAQFRWCEVRRCGYLRVLATVDALTNVRQLNW